MTTPQNVLFLGATGYIGGSVLGKLLLHPRAEEVKISAIVRDAGKAEKLQAFGVTSVVAHLDSDFSVLQTLAEDADVVFSIACGDSSKVAAAKAILAGAKVRFEATGKPTTYIHTSGAGVIADYTAHGIHSNVLTFDDSNAEQMASIAPTQLHRPLDLELLAADDQGYLKSYIIIPTTVYGLATGPRVELGIQKPQTTLLPPLIGAALARGQVGMVGAGKNVWQNVELYELADLCIVLYDAILADASPPHGRAGLYFAENGAHELVQVSKIIASIMYEHGKAQSPDPSPFTEAEEAKYLMGLASRARALGWQPKKGTEDFMNSMREYFSPNQLKNALQKVAAHPG
ncbi:hypothetical protein DFH06DRAFT_1284292 [Mycena polygramma]|nr:hypothetical protein DFH06DRAFT_1284292 [Mycena polygramma]